MNIEGLVTSMLIEDDGDEKQIYMTMEFDQESWREVKS